MERSRLCPLDKSSRYHPIPHLLFVPPVEEETGVGSFVLPRSPCPGLSGLIESPWQALPPSPPPPPSASPAQPMICGAHLVIGNRKQTAKEKEGGREQDPGGSRWGEPSRPPPLICIPEEQRPSWDSPPSAPAKKQMLQRPMADPHPLWVGPIGSPWESTKPMS